MVKIGRHIELNGILSSHIQRARKIPRLPELALNAYSENEGTTAGNFRIGVSGNSTNILVLDAEGAFLFGGLYSERPNRVTVTKIEIDDRVVLDLTQQSSGFAFIYTSEDDMSAKISGNLPPFLVNKYIKIYANNTHRNNLYFINVALSPVF